MATVEYMIPLPRALLLTSAMLVGAAVGMIFGVLAMVLIAGSVRPDAVIGLVLGFPTLIGLALLLAGGRRWLTTAGAALIAVGPGWFGALVLVQVASGG